MSEELAYYDVVRGQRFREEAVEDHCGRFCSDSSFSEGERGMNE